MKTPITEDARAFIVIRRAHYDRRKTHRWTRAQPMVTLSTALTRMEDSGVRVRLGCGCGWRTDVLFAHAVGLTPATQGEVRCFGCSRSLATVNTETTAAGLRVVRLLVRYCHRLANHHPVGWVCCFGLRDEPGEPVGCDHD